ncbi:centlein isoform X7 [Loxodonta africana]|uniref:centlein isoform X7 n=1 Tax=Loxodonta africana TaxID=9785 RepID=UPI0030D1B657
MAARSPPPPLPTPQARQSGPWSLHVVQGTKVHAVCSEALGLAGAGREVVAGKSDVSWRGEEGSGGRRGGAAAAQAPLLSAPMASGRLEGISVEEAMATRTQLLEEELSSLKEELALCQADKEFVWSLWKRLQVTNPDLTQAVSLVVEREKQKAEAKDRKILEILQVKDAKIQELEQREAGLKQEINDLAKWKIAVDEENALLRNEFSDLQKKFKDKSHELKDAKECVQNKEEQNSLVIKNLEEENEKLSTHCADLLNDLEKLRTQEAHWRKEKYSIDAKIKAFEENLIEARKEIEVSQSKYNALSLQLNNKQSELIQKDMDITLVRKELQELQNLYKQNSAHTAQQAELIQQLQVLNMDTQKVLRNQEDVHTAESISYQKKRTQSKSLKIKDLDYWIPFLELYNELHICFETTKSSEANLRQSVVNLQDQLFQMEQENAKLKEKLQESQGTTYPLPQESDSDHSQQSQENDELRDAHERRKERLQMLQTNYRAVREQLKQWEEGSGMTDIRKIKRAYPQQLRQEDSDAVWNELAYFKRENQELIIEKMNLQEELDKLKVHISIDKATIQELNACKEEEREEQLLRYGEDDGVKKSTPEKNGKEMSEQTLQKVIELENRLKSFEKSSRKLKEGNKKLMKENDFLKSLLKQHQEDAETREKELEQLRKGSGEVEKEKTELQVKIGELEREVTSLRRQVAETNEFRNENEEGINSTEKSQHSADKANSEMATTEVRSGQYSCKTTTTKVKFKAAKKKCSVGRHHTVLNHSVKVMSNVFENLSKDGWEDVSESSSDSETHTSQNLGTIIVETSQKIRPTEEGRDQKQTDQAGDNETQGKEIIQIYSNINGKTSKDSFHYNAKKPTFQKKNSKMQKSSHTTVPNRVNREKWKSKTAQKSCSNMILLRERIVSLQQQNSILQNAKKTADLSVKEYKEINEKLLHQQQISDQRFQTSRQTIKKLNLDLADLRKEKEDLLKKLESSSEVTSLAEEVSRVIAPQIQVTTVGPSRSVDLEMKQLQCKLKNATNELTKQSSNVKSLKFELLAKEEHIKEMHEKMSRMERDITMKRHLIEDLKFRQKVHLESNESINEMLENLEKKVKTLTEECSNKKVSIDSLKQRLSVAVKEKSQYEQMYHKTKEELEKKDLKLTLLVSKVNETESAMAEIETAASKQLQGLALQSEQVLEGAQKKLLLANEKVEEFTIFVKALVKELQNDVQMIRQQIRELKKMQKNRVSSKTSTRKAQTLAASILNISRSDLEEILDTEDEAEIERAKTDAENDKEWLLYIQKLLEGQLPFASYLLEAVLEKINGKKKLIEEYFTLMKDIR